MLLKNKQITEEINSEIKIYLETNDNENHNPKHTGHSKSCYKRKIYAIQSHHRKQKISYTNNLTIHLEQIGKEQQQQKLVYNLILRRGGEGLKFTTPKSPLPSMFKMYVGVIFIVFAINR